MRRLGFCVLCFLALVPSLCYAWDYSKQKTTDANTVQMRVGADFTKKWSNGLRLGLSEDVRVDMYNSLDGATFNRAYTTLSLGYAPIKYLRIDAGYTLKLMGGKGRDWSDPNEYFRHRVFLGLTASYKIDRVRLYLRERPMLEIRTDSVNLLEKNRYNWLLKSRVGLEYSVFGKPIKPYLWTEIVNTLNVPEYQLKYKNNDTSQSGHQYISDVRAALGTVWKIDKRNALNFYYRFSYGYDRDINIKKTSGKIILTEERQYQHSIGICYEFGW